MGTSVLLADILVLYSRTAQTLDRVESDHVPSVSGDLLLNWRFWVFCVLLVWAVTGAAAAVAHWLGAAQRRRYMQSVYRGMSRRASLRPEHEASGEGTGLEEFVHELSYTQDDLGGGASAPLPPAGGGGGGGEPESIDDLLAQMGMSSLGGGVGEEPSGPVQYIDVPGSDSARGTRGTLASKMRRRAAKRAERDLFGGW